MAHRTARDPLVKYLVYVCTYLVLVMTVTAYLMPDMIDTQNPADINGRIRHLFSGKIVQHGIEQNAPQLYLDNIPITTEFRNPYSRNAVMDNGHLMIFEPGTSDSDINVIRETYTRMLGHEITRQRKKVAGIALLVWLIPCLVLYVVGWRLQWWLKEGQDVDASGLLGARMRRGRWKRYVRTYYAGDE